jgi:hypothetical protein
LSQLAWAHPKAVTATAPAGASPRVAEERYGYPSDCRAERLLAVSSGKQVLYSPNFGKDMCSQVGLPLCCDSRKFIEPEDRPGEATHSLCSSYAPLGCRDAPRAPPYYLKTWSLLCEYFPTPCLGALRAGSTTFFARQPRALSPCPPQPLASRPGASPTSYRGFARTPGSRSWPCRVPV